MACRGAIDIPPDPRRFSGKTGRGHRRLAVCGTVPCRNRTGWKSRRRASASGGPAKPVLGNLATERVPVHAEQVGGLAEVPVGLGQDERDELLLELPVGILPADALVHHFIDQSFELFLHGDTAGPVYW